MNCLRFEIWCGGRSQRRGRSNRSAKISFHQSLLSTFLDFSVPGEDTQQRPPSPILWRFWLTLCNFLLEYCRIIHWIYKFIFIFYEAATLSYIADDLVLMSCLLCSVLLEGTIFVSDFNEQLYRTGWLGEGLDPCDTQFTALLIF